MIRILNKFFNFSGPDNKRKFYWSIFLGVLKAFFEAFKIPAIAILLQEILNGNITEKGIFGSFGIMMISIIGTAIVNYQSTILQTEAGYGTCADKRIEIAEHLRYLPMGYFNKNSLGYITSVATNTMESVADVATRVVMMCTQGVITTLIITAFIFVYDARMGIIVIAGLFFFFAVNNLLRKVSADMSAWKSRSDSELVSQVIEYVQGISEVKAYNQTGSQSEKLNRAIWDNVDCCIKCELKYIPYLTIQSLIIKVVGVVMSMTAIYFYLTGTMDLLVTIIMMLCSFMVFSSLESAGTYSSLLRVVDLGVQKAQEILDTETMDINGEDLTPENFDIDLKDVEFSYNDKKVIQGVTFNIPEKTTTAIIGPSGGGKTTLCHLIARFWDIQKGSITLGGENIKKYNIDSLMKNFSFIFQSVYLFQDTIANNIRFGQPEASMDQVIDAAKKARCHDFIIALPDGYDTVIGEGGASLSGGEKQRISIARAIMKDAPVIILDEATANVDPENEKELMNAIQELTREKTIIMIAHRLKTVINADQILVIENGRIAQKGTHDSLIKQEGIYKKFIDARKLAVGWKL